MKWRRRLRIEVTGPPDASTGNHAALKEEEGSGQYPEPSYNLHRD
jgi:hypothetical protein